MKGQIEIPNDGPICWAFEDTWKTSGSIGAQGASFFTATVSSHSGRMLTKELHRNIGECHQRILSTHFDSPEECLKAIELSVRQASKETEEVLQIPDAEDRQNAIRISFGSLFVVARTLVVVSVGASRVWRTSSGRTETEIVPICASDAKYISGERYDPVSGLKPSQYILLPITDTEHLVVTATPEDLSDDSLSNFAKGGLSLSECIESAIEVGYERSGQNKMYPKSYVAFQTRTPSR